MIGLKLCPHCGSRQHVHQPDSNRQTQIIYYECGNSMQFTFGEHDNILSHEDYDTCKNKVDWTDILVPYNDEFDNNAKRTDERFFGWIELQHFLNYHGIGWKNKFAGRNCNETEFLDEYFSGKEIYLSKVKDINTNIIYAFPITQTTTKDYPDWIGPVTMREIHKSVKDGVETMVYMVLSSEWDQSDVGGYVVERNPIGGGDQGRNFYERNILDIIIENEKR